LGIRYGNAGRRGLPGSPGNLAKATRDVSLGGDVGFSPGEQKPAQGQGNVPLEPSLAKGEVFFETRWGRGFGPPGCDLFAQCFGGWWGGGITSIYTIARALNRGHAGVRWGPPPPCGNANSLTFTLQPPPLVRGERAFVFCGCGGDGIKVGGIREGELDPLKKIGGG